MPINVNITEKDGNYICWSRSSFDQWHFKNVYSIFNSKAEIINQYTDGRTYIKEGIVINNNDNPTTKRHFTAHLKEVKRLIEDKNKPEPEEFDGYVAYDNGRYSRIVKAKIKIASDKRFEFKDECFLSWQTVNVCSYSYIKANPEIDKLYDEYKTSEEKYKLSEQKIKNAIYKKEK